MLDRAQGKRSCFVFLKFFPAICPLIALSVLTLVNSVVADTRPVLTVVAYDSFASKHGIGPVIKTLFESKCGCELKILPSGDAGQMLSRLELDAERKKISAQVAIGIDQSLWPRAQPLAEGWREGTAASDFSTEPRGLDAVAKELKIAPDFFPFDYGTYAWMVDTQLLAEQKISKPQAWSDLEKDDFKKKLLIEDPRTSTPGLGLLLYTKAVYREKFSEFWKKMRNQWLTLPPGWSQAYGLFMKGQAPLVWSYTASQAYHTENPEKNAPEKSNEKSKPRYQALLLKNAVGKTESPVQVEGAILIRGGSKTAEQKALARKFIEFLLSAEVQKEIPLKNWMIPARGDVKLPASFAALPVPEVRKVITPKTRAEVDGLLKEWQEAILK